MGDHGFRDAGHLPKRRPGQRAADPYELPRQRRGVTPQMHGRYPDYDVIEQAPHWDEATRKVVLGRLDDPPPIRFFTPAEAATLEAFCSTLMAQDRDPRVPIVAHVDRRLYEHQLDGFQYADMPDDRDTWRLLARALDEAAEGHGVARFALASDDLRAAIVDRLSKGQLEGGVWEQLPIRRAWQVVTRMVLSVFYSHPWAWNEIGYGGPAYPRGFARLGIGQSEAWEAMPAFDPDPVEDVRERGLE